jgi:glyoxylase-like metal-dependent hydrolase (beta-lactamase superfamily II)
MEIDVYVNVKSTNKDQGVATSDQSLQDVEVVDLPPVISDAPLRFRDLDYPTGRWAPAPGEVHEVAPGVMWIRMPLTFSLNHINLWALDDGDSWVIVDSGVKLPICIETWEKLLAGPLAGKPIGRIIVTHYHPDHVGLAGWLAERSDAPVLMARAEYFMARLLCADVRDTPPADALKFFRQAGWKASWVDALYKAGWGNFAKVVWDLPIGYQRISDGDELRIGGRTWRIVTGTGHAPEHSCLLCEELGVLISGDQVLPRITSNVSVYPTEPEANPLKDWMDSLEALKRLPADLFVLPSHNEPFTGLHTRCDQLLADHRGKLDRLLAWLNEPRTVIDCFDVVFGRKLKDEDRGMATGEALAHLNYLLRNDLAVRTFQDGVAYYTAA